LVDEKHTLEREFEEVARQPPVKQRKNEEILDAIENHEGMLKLFHLLKETSNYNSFLFLHTLDLFGMEGKHSPPYLLFGRCTDRREDENYISQALQDLKIDHQAKSAIGLPKLFEQFGIDVDKQKAIGIDIADVIVYALVSFIRSSDKLKTLVQAEEFNYSLLRETMKDYSKLVDTEQLKTQIDSISSKEPSDPNVRPLIRRLLFAFIPLITRSPLGFLDSTKLAQSEYAVGYHQRALKVLGDLQEKTSISFETYTSLMDRLYSYQLIENSHTIIWCETCFRERTIYYEIHGRIAPSKLIDRDCRECSGKESFSSVYRVDPLLLDSIFSRDGLLSIYLSWYLRNEGVSFESGVYFGGKEIDILVGSTLIECKNFRLGGREDTLRENLSQTLIQIQKQVNALEEDGRSVDRVILLCNQPEMKSERNNMKSDLIDFLDRYNIEIYGPDDISAIVDTLK
jgi:hypothetical protein